MTALSGVAGATLNGVATAIGKDAALGVQITTGIVDGIAGDVDALVGITARPAGLAVATIATIDGVATAIADPAALGIPVLTGHGIGTVGAGILIVGSLIIRRLVIGRLIVRRLILWGLVIRSLIGVIRRCAEFVNALQIALTVAIAVAILADR